MIPEHLLEAIVRVVKYKGSLLGQNNMPKEQIEASIKMFENDMFKVFCEGEPDAFIFGAIMPYHLCLSVKHATILVSWFTEEKRGIKSIALVKKFIDWAEANGADQILVDDCLCTPSIGRVYTKWGFTKLETHYYKITGDK